ncbi:uncharacterized protein LOC114522486 [Dendronephthya gigantea]|uniref:uncharacterized protein LOC114522486 n=1 Tax=Dendronephthya gigantea TaxID=151771 RepID=UPI00106BC42C|nr:uncharacterized protein LOC114522486 [Dendronephthya gigantea]
MSVSSNNEFGRVFVTGIPEEVTEKQVHIHFQQTKNGGGEIERVTLLSGGKATVVFTDPKVAREVVKRQQILKGKVVEVKFLGGEAKSKVETFQNEASSIETRARTILVTGLPTDGVTEKGLEIHFQKKRNGGGDVKKITLLPEGKAFVVFEDPEVARAVVNREQILKGKVLEIELMERESLKKVRKSNKDKSLGGKTARTISVSGLPEDATENSVYIHFQKKRNSGGEVEKVEILGNGKAIVTFEEPRVAMNVVNTTQMTKEKVLDVKLAEMEESEDEEMPEKEPGTIHISGLPEGTTGNNIHIHFQKKKNNGGEVKEVKYFPEKNEAVIVFEDIQVAKKVIEKEQVLHGKKLVVKLQTTDTGSRSERLGSDEEERKSDKERTVLVFDLPDGTTENGVHIHFQKKKNMGGEIEKTVILPGNRAVVVFEDSEVARSVVETPQQMKGKCLTVILLNKESSTETKRRQEDETKEKPETETELESTTSESVGTPEISRGKMDDAASGVTNLNDIDQVYGKVTASVNPVIMSTGLEQFWSNVFNIIQKSCGVQCHVASFGVLVTGSLSQVTRAGEILNLQLKRHRQNGSNLNQSDANFNQPEATKSNQMGRTLSPGDPTPDHDPYSSLTPSNQTFKPYDTANIIDNSYQRGYFESSGNSLHWQPQDQFYQGNTINQPSNLRQPEWMKKVQNDTHYSSDNSRFRGGHLNQYPYPMNEMKYFHRPPPGFPQHAYFQSQFGFGPPPNTPPQYTARSPSAGDTPSDVTNRERAEHQTTNHQHGNTPPEVEGTSLSSTVFSNQVMSPNSARNFHQHGYNQFNTTPNHFAEQILATSSANEKPVLPNGTSDGTTNYQPPGRAQQPLNPKTAPEGSTKPNNQHLSSSNNKHSRPFTNPNVHPPTSINPSDNAGSPSDEQPDTHFENVSSAGDITPKSPTNDQKVIVSSTTKNQDESDPEAITESHQHPSPLSNSNPAVSNPLVSPDIGANPQQTNNDQQPETPEPPSDEVISNNSSNKAESLLNERPQNSDTTIPKLPDDDQKMTRNTPPPTKKMKHL